MESVGLLQEEQVQWHDGITCAAKEVQEYTAAIDRLCLLAYRIVRYWSDLIENIDREGVNLNSFVHSEWHKHS